MNHFEKLNKYIKSEYHIEDLEILIDSKPLKITYVKDIDSLIDQIPPEQFDIDERLPYWADIWPSALALAYYSEHIKCENRTVLELGSGVGLAGVAFAAMGARVTFSDYEDEALKFAQLNAFQNNIDRFNAINLDWRNPTLSETFDYIIGADIIYEERQFIPVINMIKQFLNVGGKAYIAEPNRSIAFQFFHELKKHSYSYRKFKQHIHFNKKDQYISICEIYQ